MHQCMHWMCCAIQSTWVSSRV